MPCDEFFEQGEGGASEDGRRALRVLAEQRASDEDRFFVHKVRAALTMLNIPVVPFALPCSSQAITMGREARSAWDM